MNYIKPEDIKEYVSKNPEGIAGMSEELAVMVNHFAELIVKECVSVADEYVRAGGNGAPAKPTAKSLIGIEIQKHFGVEE